MRPARAAEEIIAHAQAEATRSDRTSPPPSPTSASCAPPAAAAAVRAAHLIPIFTGQTSGNAWVCSQSPQPGTLVELDSTVRLHVRSGPIL